MMTDTQSEQTLIGRAVCGDLDAFNELVLQLQDMVYRHASNTLGDPDAADDVTQETFIRAFQSLSNFRGGSFRAWIMKIATNAALDRLRSAGRHPSAQLYPVNEDDEEQESPVWLADQSASVQEMVERNEVSHRLYQMLEELPVAFRTVITLVDLYEFDYQEAAQVLNVPVGTIRSRLARARMQMRKRLQGAADKHLAWAW